MMTIDNNSQEIPEHWQSDQLDRYAYAKKLKNVIEEIDDPAVILLDHKYGVGKSFFLERFVTDLKQAGHFSFLYDAWANDFTDMPGVSFYSAFSRALESDGDLGSFVDINLLESADALITSASKNALLSLSNIVTKAIGMGGVRDIVAQHKSGLSDDNSEYRAVSELVQFKKKWEKRKTFKEKFGEVIARIAEHKSESVEGRKVIIAIDELDRCHPDFSITLLEEIKHLFRTDKIVFLIAADKEQLKSSAETIVGSSDDILDGYLRKFFDLEITFPEVNHKSFCEVEYTEKIEQLQEDNEHHKTGNPICDAHLVIDSVCHYAEYFETDLRTIKRIFDRIKVCCLFAENHIYFPRILAFLIFLKIHRKNDYVDFKNHSGVKSYRHIWDKRKEYDGDSVLHQLLNDAKVNCELELIQHDIDDLLTYYDQGNLFKFSNEVIAGKYLKMLFENNSQANFREKKIKDYLISIIEYQR